MTLTYFDLMISILIVICNHVHCKAFYNENLGQVVRNHNLGIQIKSLYKLVSVTKGNLFVSYENG